jgi:hypothetical protein
MTQFSSAVDHAHDIGANIRSGAGTSVHPFIDIVVFQAQRAAHDRMHHVGAGDVGEFEDLFVAEMLLQRFEHAVRHAPALQHQRVGVGQQGPLQHRCNQVATCQWGMAWICSSVHAEHRGQALQCCEKTNRLPTA